MKVIFRYPKPSERELPGRRRVGDVLRELNLPPDSYMVIRGNQLLTRDEIVAEDDTIELRPVMSGGSTPCAA